MLRDLPIRRKMLLIVLVTTTLALLVAAAALVLQEVGTFRPRVLADLELQARILTTNMHARLDFDDPETATQELATLRYRPEISAACVYDRNGDIFATYRGTSAAEFVFPPVPAGSSERFSTRHLVMVRPIVHQDETRGHLYLRYDLRPILTRLPQYGLTFLLVLGSLGAVAAMLSWTLQRVTRPLRELADAAQAVTAGETYDVRVPQQGNDEVGQLTAAFNGMLDAIGNRERALRRAADEQETLQEQLSEAQKLESIGRLAGGVAHDFNNLLTVIVGASELAIHRLPTGSQARPLLDNVLKATTQATHLTHQLLAFARKQATDPRSLDLAQLTRESASMLSSLLGDDIELEVSFHDGLWPVHADPSQLVQVLMNLAANARDAMPEGGALTMVGGNLRLEPQDVGVLHPGVPAGEWVLTTVRDTGVGIPEDAREHIFEPFFTTKPEGEGTGLGLATCYGIARQSGGHLLCTSAPGEGTTMALYLPRARQAATSVAVDAKRALEGGDETLLLVEDNPLVRATAVEQIRLQGYTVLEAANGIEALRVAQVHGREIDLLVTDVVMPKMSGHELATHMRGALPILKVLFVSGYASDTVLRLDNDGSSAFLQKPYTQIALLERIRTLLDA